MAIDTFEKRSGLERFLGVFGDVRAGEGLNCVMMFFNIFLLLVAYYVLKTVREPLVLVAGGAELKTYASAAQAAALLLYVPIYGWVASRLPAKRLVVVVLLFFLACIQLFFALGLAGTPYLGFAFYVWVGIFSLTCIAQFWSFANDIYEKPVGDRLFPLIAVGATAGAPLGAWLAEKLFAAGMSIWLMMQVASALLILHLLLYSRVRPGGAKQTDVAPASRRNGFALVLNSPYLRFAALLLVLLNIVNTTGEYILAGLVTNQASATLATEAQQSAFIGAFYGNYFFWVNIASVFIQAFLVSRIVKAIGLAGALLALPVVALGAYGLAATGASLMLVRWVKTAENATDYSFMNTGKQMLWLPTTREQKYEGKQAVDTFFVRFGDMLAAGVVFFGTQLIPLSVTGFAVGNIFFLLLSLAVVLLLLREHRRLTTAGQAIGESALGKTQSAAKVVG